MLTPDLIYKAGLISSEERGWLQRQLIRPLRGQAARWREDEIIRLSAVHTHTQSYTFTHSAHVS